MTAAIAFDNSFARLPGHFFARVSPSPVGAPRLIRLNRPLAVQLGLDADWLESPEGVDMLVGRRLPAGTDPIATAYAGHQFGQFVPQLGDGRAILLGEVVDRDGRRRDIQLKGAGRTPFSRGGDGRAALGPVLREYIVSEAMAALGIPTTRALAAVLTGEHGGARGPAARRDPHPRRGEPYPRRHLPVLRGARRHAGAARSRRPCHRPPLSRGCGCGEAVPRRFCEAVIAAQAALVARWLLVGFIHGVMNTDNTSIAGETIDYGPCAFLDAYDPATVFSSIDQHGRYAYANQPRIAHWNLARFAETLLPLLADTAENGVTVAEEALQLFPSALETALNAGFRRKLGLGREQDGDLSLASDLLRLMAEAKADFTLTYRYMALAAGESDAPLLSLFADEAGIAAWLSRWRARLADEPCRPERTPARDAKRESSLHPAQSSASRRPSGPRTRRPTSHRSRRFVAVLSRPFEERAGLERYAAPPQEHERVRQTFCGT